MTATTITSLFYVAKEPWRDHPVIDFLRGRNYHKVRSLCLPYSQDKITDKWSAMNFLDDLEECRIEGLDIYDTTNQHTIAWVRNVIDFAITTDREDEYFEFFTSREDAMDSVIQTHKESEQHGFPIRDYFINEHICP
jgi:uncharacterized protein with ATP-grasp and redox domains